MAGRLTLALEAGDVSIADVSRVAVFGPPADYDLSAFPSGRTIVIQGFRPDHDAWARRGYTVSPEPPEAATAAVVVLPRARAAALAMLAAARDAVGDTGTIIVDGAKDHGVEAILKTLRGLATCSPAFSKAHGKVFSVTGGVFPEDWRGAAQTLPEGFVTMPGSFSADGIDPGSEALAAHFTDALKGRAADLGAGWGYLSHRLLAAAPGIVSLDLYESDHAAIGAARRNVTDPRAVFHWADVTALGRGAACDVVVSNPPFHTGNRADPELGRAFIRAAAGLLSARGEFLMVANRHLPYEAALTAVFGEVAELPGPAAFKIFRARRPRTGR